MPGITIASRKAKGRGLQQWCRDTLLELFPSLTEDDIRSTSMGAGGVDVLLSSAAKRLIPIKIEAKNQEKYKGLYATYDQARSHSGPEEPVLVLKINRRAPLLVIDAEYFFNLLKVKT